MAMLTSALVCRHTPSIQNSPQQMADRPRQQQASEHSGTFSV